MLVKLNSLLSKLLIAVVVMLMNHTTTLYASSCDYRVFSIKSSDNLPTMELLSQIADNCDFSIVVKDSVAQSFLNNELYGINIKELSLQEIFDVLLNDNDLYYEYDSNFLKISALKTETFKIDYITSIRQGTAVLNASVDATPTEEGGTREVTGDNSITSNDTFDFWSTIATEITSVMNTGADGYSALAPIINQNGGLITVTGTKKQIDRVAEYIEVLQENLHRQVLIDVSIFTVDLEDSQNTGIDWSQFSLTLNSDSNLLNFVSGDDSSSAQVDTSYTIASSAVFSMEGLVDFLKRNGDTQVISNPKVLTMNNQQALITVGDNINYRVLSSENSADSTGTVSESYDNYSIFIGVLLNITPEITEENEIILRINPSVSDFKYAEDDGRQITPREIAPDTSEKKLSTVVKVQNNNTIILGGLITNSEGFDNSNVPILSDIPILGEAFKHTNKTTTTQELVFVITPRIIGPKDDTRSTLKDLGFSKRIYEQ